MISMDFNVCPVVHISYYTLSSLFYYDSADITTTKDTDSEEETSAIKDNLCRSGSVGRDGHGGDNACNVRENERVKIAETPKLQGTRRTGSAY
mmetsp:Transcript_36507/g.74329  ORF Transcript_36507/g.74329 Transcript_36507/m.74329 type:complete len:93 (-) Transcript_36507:63-341(-)